MPFPILMCVIRPVIPPVMMPVIPRAMMPVMMPVIPRAMMRVIPRVTMPVSAAADPPVAAERREVGDKRWFSYFGNDFGSVAQRSDYPIGRRIGRCYPV